MAHQFAKLAFTPSVRELQLVHGSRANYAPMDNGEDYNHRLGAREREFIVARDSFYLASVSETGWPYLQHRGGPAGFMKVLDDRTIGFADYSGNRQYVSAGNFRGDDRVALFFMDYPNRRRLKMLGRMQMVDAEDPALVAQVEDPDYPAQVERIATIRVEAFDWNCPQHITPRFTDVELGRRMEQPAESVAASAPASNHTIQQISADTPVVGEGPLSLCVSGMRQLTPSVRGFELRHANGEALPEFAPGSHIVVPLRLGNGELTDRHYSIASDPARRDVWEIAVQREDAGLGGSRALHQQWQLGTQFRTALPINHFALHEDSRSTVLIAGGIGITPIKAMAHELSNRQADFVLHYAGRSTAQMAFREELTQLLGERLVLANSADNNRLNLEAIFNTAGPDAVFYLCGPDRLIGAALKAAKHTGVARERVQIESFV
ncbi:MAG: pyridoxamine 5'-phosphate oxidase family protein [Pseudomonadales bacterium]